MISVHLKFLPYAMIIVYYTFSISLAFTFAIFGLLINNAIKHRPFYRNLSAFNFIANHSVNKYLGIIYFKKILATTFWKKFNPTLNIGKTSNRAALIALRNEMTYAEISHIIAFLLILIFIPVIYAFQFYKGIITPLFIANIIFHLYPAMVQQYNKRRLDKIIVRIQP